MSPPRYRLVVEGELGPRYASAFDGMTLRAHNPRRRSSGRSSTPRISRGVLERIAGLGLTLHSLNPLETENAETGAQPHPQPAGVNNDPGTAFEGTVNS